ncbi:DUF6646 family protein [Olleya sp. R77988]|uniref:DUF6646 family protein n=1 Tax=Olleya sp. R77988 TaxID=3093875 RepID=UPI0037CA78A1
MKKIFLALTLLATTLTTAQSFEGKGDQKFQIGANFQDNVNGITLAYDYGLGENIFCWCCNRLRFKLKQWFICRF